MIKIQSVILKIYLIQFSDNDQEINKFDLFNETNLKDLMKIINR